MRSDTNISISSNKCLDKLNVRAVTKIQVARHVIFVGGVSSSVDANMKQLGGSWDMIFQKILKCRGPEMPFPAFSHIFPLQM